MPFVIVVPDLRLPKLTNQMLLEISLTAFFGAIASNSLSLLGDAASMSVDVTTYIANMYGEWVKEKHPRSVGSSSAVLDVAIPFLSTAALVAVTVYLVVDSLLVLQHPPSTNAVDPSYLYGFALANLAVDALCGGLFVARGEAVFVEADAVPQLSLDTSTSIDDFDFSGGVFGYLGSPQGGGHRALRMEEEEDYGELEEDDDIQFSDTHKLTGARGHCLSCSWCSCCWRCCRSVWDLLALYLCCVKPPASAYSHSLSRGHIDIARKPARKNLNMLAAFTHVLGDTLRTVAVLAAAVVSTVTGIDGDICDAWAALLVALTILVLCCSLLREIVAAARSEKVQDELSGDLLRMSGGWGACVQCLVVAPIRLCCCYCCLAAGGIGVGGSAVLRVASTAGSPAKGNTGIEMSPMSSRIQSYLPVNTSADEEREEFHEFDAGERGKGGDGTKR
jgi:Co/Zn/Cd efflux system component